METLNLPKEPIDLLPGIWAGLENAIQDYSHPWRTAVLGTVSDSTPHLRTVVLRDFIPEERLLICHTDIRSEKVTQLSLNPTATWLFYNPELKVQVQCTGSVKLDQNSDRADQIWEQATASQRMMYLAPQRPGSTRETSQANLSGEISGFDQIDLKDTEVGRRNFCLISTTIFYVEWLQLHPSGNRRAKFDLRGGGCNAEWIAA